MNAEFVDKYYEMDPETEDLLFDGTKLENGMVVTVGTCFLREDVSTALEGMRLENAKRYNRWCTISELLRGISQVSFIATYEDGTKKKMVFDPNHPWLVKKDSIPLGEKPTKRGILPHEATPSLTQDVKVANLVESYNELDDTRRRANASYPSIMDIEDV